MATEKRKYISHVMKGYLRREQEIEKQKRIQVAEVQRINLLSLHTVLERIENNVERLEQILL